MQRPKWCWDGPRQGRIKHGEWWLMSEAFCCLRSFSFFSFSFLDDAILILENIGSMVLLVALWITFGELGLAHALTWVLRVLQTFRACALQTLWSLDLVRQHLKQGVLHVWCCSNYVDPNCWTALQIAPKSTAKHKSMFATETAFLRPRWSTVFLLVVMIFNV